MITCADVEIEIVETWPSGIREAATQNRDLLLRYQQERKRIERLGWTDVSVRINPPINEYKKDYDALVDRLDASLTQHRIVGYHCTRLTPGEIEAITVTGLRVLSPELVRTRFDQCVADGHMTDRQREYLLNSPRVLDSLANRHGNRTGMIWLCPNRSTLKDASGVYRLFRNWGGEAVYGGHEGDDAIGGDLVKIGAPAIVKCAIPFPCDDPYYPKFAARFLSQFIASDIEFAEPSADFDLRTTTDIPASQVLEIIEFSDSRFEAMTGSSDWSEHCGIKG